MADLEAKSTALDVEYCPHCTLPLEYCEFSSCFEQKCLPWLQEQHPDILEAFGKLNLGQTGEGQQRDTKDEKGGAKETAKTSKKSKRGGGKKQEAKQEKAYLHISVAQRGRKKHITTLKGVHTIGLKAKDVSKIFSKRFACSCTVGRAADGTREVLVQGDVQYDMADFLVEKFEADEDIIFYVAKGGRKSRAF